MEPGPYRSLVFFANFTGLAACFLLSFNRRIVQSAHVSSGASIGWCSIIIPEFNMAEELQHLIEA